MHKKIGIYSGSFNPIHVGHTMLAEYISKNADIDELWLLVSPQNPLKIKSDLVSDFHRYNMVKLDVAKLSRVKVSDFELKLPQPTYTYNTLLKLRETYPLFQFYLIIGSDNWLIFDKWKNYDKIISEFSMLIYPRPGYEINEFELPKNVRLLKNVPLKDLSSSLIRDAIREGNDVSEYLSPQVKDYIDKNNLYH